MPAPPSPAALPADPITKCSASRSFTFRISTCVSSSISCCSSCSPSPTCAQIFESVHVPASQCPPDLPAAPIQHSMGLTIIILVSACPLHAALPAGPSHHLLRLLSSFERDFETDACSFWCHSSSRTNFKSASRWRVDTDLQEHALDANALQDLVGSTIKVNKVPAERTQKYYRIPKCNC